MDLDLGNGIGETDKTAQQKAISDLMASFKDINHFSACCSGSCPQGFIVGDSDSALSLVIIDDFGNKVQMTKEQFKVLADSFLVVESCISES